MVLKLLITSLLIISNIILLALCVMIYTQKKIKDRKYLFLLLLSCAVYSTGYGIEIQGTTLRWIYFSLAFEYFGISFISAFLFLFALTYITDIEKLSPLLKIFIYTIPVITLITAITDPYHDLLHKNPFIDYSGPFPIISFEKGIWYWVHIAYHNIMLLMSNIIFLIIYFKSYSRYRSQAAILFLSTLIPWITMIIYLSGITQWPLDINPFSFSIMGMILYFGVKRQNLINIIPIGRDIVFENMYDAALVLNMYGVIVDYNRAAENIFYDTKILLGKNIKEILSDVSLSEYNINDNVNQLNEIIVNDKIYNVQHLPLTSVKNKPMGFIFILRDITEYRKLTDQLQELAITDELTGLFNRRKFNEITLREFIRAKRNNSSLAVIMIDIDYFKKINDKYGHAAGDIVLKIISKNIKSALRSLDILARFGGEEFIICLPETDIIAAQKVAERIRMLICNGTYIITDNDHINVSISLGVSALQENHKTLEELINTSDKALYHSKNTGRNKVTVFCD